jgi:myosin heavy subunit
MNKNTITEQKELAETEKSVADSSLKEVKGQYDAALVRLDGLVNKNNQLDSLVNNKDGEISKLKTQINQIMSKTNKTKADMEKAKSLIAQLNTKVKSYEEQIEQLKGENGKLVEVNGVLTKERDSTVADNIGLKNKVKLGAVLHASNIRMTPIHEKKFFGKGEKATTKAKRVDIMRITFDIDENRIAESGMKQIFIAITAADGKVLTSAAYGSGVTSLADGTSLSYTLFKQIQLQQAMPVKNLDIDWKQSGNYETGTYKIDIYNEGYKIGSGSVTLK